MYKNLSIDHKIDYFKKQKNNIPKTKFLHRKLINLPIHNNLSFEDCKKVAKTILKVIELKQ